MKKISFLCLAVFLASPVFGQEETLSLDNLVSLALERNPRVQAALKLAQAQRFRVAPEGALPDPVVGFSLKNIGLDRFSVGEEMMSGVGVSFSQTIPFPGKLRLKSEMAEKRALQAEQTIRATKLSLVREIKELYAKLFYYDKSTELILKKKSLLDNARQIAETRYSVGQGIQADVFKAQVEISSAEEMLLTMSQMAKVTRININTLLDFPAENRIGVPREIPFYRLALDLPQLEQATRENSPLLKEKELMVEEESLAVKMAQKEFYPDFMIQGGKEFKGPFKDMYEVMVGVEIPLFYGRKQANLLEEARLELSSAQSHYRAMKNEASSMVNEEFLMAKTAEGLISLYREKIIPQANLALESSLANYKVGREDFLSLLSDINTLIFFEMDYIKNLSGLWRAAAKIEELTSIELIKDGGETENDRIEGENNG